MTEFLLPGRLTSESEFNGGSGACGPCALGVAARWSKQTPTPVVQSLVPLLASQRLCGPTGISDTPKLRTAARNLGFHIENPNPDEDKTHFAGRALQAVQGAHLGAVVMQFTNGQAFREYLTGSGEDAVNLQGHFICLVGYNSGGFSPFFGMNVPQGFLAADGDQNLQNPIITGSRVHRQLNTQLCYYPLSTVLAAHPYDAFSILQEAIDPLTLALNKLSSIAVLAGS